MELYEKIRSIRERQEIKQKDMAKLLHMQPNTYNAYENGKRAITTDILKNIFTSLKYWLLGLSIMVISNSIITIVTNETLAANEEAVRNLIDTHPLYMAFQLIIYAPLTEELIFRKSIREITNNKAIYILLTGLIFGGMHVISSIQSAKDLLYLIPYCSLGFTFGYLYTKTDNIFSTITAHATHNTLALILYLTQVMS